jgi:hypothetical protein
MATIRILTWFEKFGAGGRFEPTQSDGNLKETFMGEENQDHSSLLNN